jgi:hypothetical protein
MELLYKIITKTTNSNQIDKNAKIITLHDNFNQKIKEFPKYLSYLGLGYSFRQKDIIFPQYLLYLSLGLYYMTKNYNRPRSLRTVITSVKQDYQLK